MQIFKTSAKKCSTAIVVATLAATMGCSDFLSVGGDPNRSQTAGAKQLFVGVQSATWAMYGSDLSRIMSLFSQQAIGTGAQYGPLYAYGISENTTNEQHTALYEAGGLVDVRNLKRIVEASGDDLFLGIAQVQEALIMSLGADIFGDLVYSEALKGGNPPLDDQLDVYAALIVQLDSAITNINSPAVTSTGPEAADLVYWTGNSDVDRAAQRARWTRLAHSLKARIYMHMAEVDPSNYARALASAQLGILDPDDDYQANYSGAGGESNLLYQFVVELRPNDMAPNPFIITLMEERDDPRFDSYFAPVGSGFGYGPGVLSRTAPQKIMTADETRLIWAEAAYRGGATGSAGAAATQLAAYRSVNGYPSLGTLSGANLLRAILTEKYIALFNQIEPWNDWKRTCFPNIPRVGSTDIPARLFYDANERNTNPNVPPPSGQPVRNDNDPENATDPFGNACLGNNAGAGGGNAE